MKNKLKLSVAGFAAIKQFEGLRLKAYKDVAGVWTIGYGSTYHKDGTRIKPGDVLKDNTAADDLFSYTLITYEDAVNQLVKVALNQNQYDALVSFTYNEGTGALAMSHLLINTNAGNFSAAGDEFLKWNKITDPVTKEKKVCNDLVLRRKRERLLFLKPVI
jgi:lysozyme